MAKWDREYINLCKEIMEYGTEVENRTGINTIKLPYKHFEFDLEEEFPILTTKFVAFKSAILEMLWIYQTQSNDVRWLQERGVKIWNEWQIDENGYYNGKYFGQEYAYTIGTAYGYIVNKYQLIQNLIETLKNNPTDRRMNMSLWQNDYLETAALPSCVWDSMWDVTDGKLNVVVTQRSCDVALGLPFNVTQYAVLQTMIARVTGLKPGKLYWSAKDVHLYVDQIEGIKEQIKRYEELGDFEAPKLWVNPDIKDFFKFDNSKELKDIKLIDYEHHGKIQMPVAI
ncbi:MAG: thymidylate synthase [Bacilli bacterium]|nr:thymidylate synthase [Bacilli bacterium]MDD4808580.1 thymidylate synthase [Bacilli bacterium]